jgi:hypothetical protein
MTPPPDKTLEEFAKEFADGIWALQTEPQRREVAARFIEFVQSATADLRAEVERLRRNAIVSHLMQGELETQLATERDRNKVLLEWLHYSGQHRLTCASALLTGPCDCGLEKLLTTPPSATEGQT